MTDGKTIAFFPEPGAWGPTNNCVAIANVLQERGHRIVFVVDESFRGVLEAKGFEERLMRMAPPEENADPDADPWAEFIRVTAPEFAKPTIEQIETVTKPIWAALVAGERYSHDTIMGIWDEVRPDVVVTDNVTGYPAIELAGAPWVRFVSANPLEMRDELLPPVLSGLPVADRSQWQPFREEYHRQHAELLAEHNDFRTSVGVAPCPAGRVQHALAVAEPLPVPRGRGLREGRTAGPDVAPARSRRSAPGRRPSTSRRWCRATARSCTCPSARWGAWTWG